VIHIAVCLFFVSLYFNLIAEFHVVGVYVLKQNPSHRMSNGCSWFSLLCYFRGYLNTTRNIAL